MPLGNETRRFWIISIWFDSIWFASERRTFECSPSKDRRRIKTLFFTNKQTKKQMCLWSLGPCRDAEQQIQPSCNLVKHLKQFVFSLPHILCVSTFDCVFACFHVGGCVRVCLWATVGCRRGYILQQLSCMRLLRPSIRLLRGLVSRPGCVRQTENIWRLFGGWWLDGWTQQQHVAHIG